MRKLLGYALLASLAISPQYANSSIRDARTSANSRLEQITERDANSYMLNARRNIESNDFHGAIGNLQRSFDVYDRSAGAANLNSVSYLLILGESYLEILSRLDKNSNMYGGVVEAVDKSFHLARATLNDFVKDSPERKFDTDTKAYYARVWSDLTNFYQATNHFERAFYSSIAWLHFEQSPEILKKLVDIASKVPKDVLESNWHMLFSILGAEETELLFKQMK